MIAVLFYADHPVEFVEDIIGAKPDEEQANILRSLAEKLMTQPPLHARERAPQRGLLSGLSAPALTRKSRTAPTQHQLYDILWAEVSKWLRSNPALQREITWTQERVYMTGAKENEPSRRQNIEHPGRPARLSL